MADSKMMAPAAAKDNFDNEFTALVVKGRDVAWYKTLKNLLDCTPTVSTLQEALDPMLEPISRAPEGLGFTVAELRQVIDDTLVRMTDKLLLLMIDGRYNEHHAGSLNIYTQDKPKPQWFKFMSRHLNDTVHRCSQGDVSDEITSCLKFLKFFMVALEALPAEYIHDEECWRGVNWVFPGPLFEESLRQRYFYEGRQSFFFTTRSFSADIDVATRIAGTGFRTIFKMERGCLGYKIWDFSEFPAEKEVVFPLLDEYQVKVMQANIEISQEHANEKTSNFHKGEPDYVHIMHRVRQPMLHKAKEVEKLERKKNKHFPDLSFFFRNGSLMPSLDMTPAETSAQLVVQARDAMIASIEKKVKGKPVLFLVGATGSGKSTLSNWLVGSSVKVQKSSPDIESNMGYGLSMLERLAGPAEVADIHIEKAAVTGSDCCDGDDDDDDVIEKAEIDFSVGKDGTKSMTFLPKAIEVSHTGLAGGVVVVDFPGFFDSTNTEIRIAVDLAFRELVNESGKAFVLALAEISSVAASRGESFRAQLEKLKRHLPLVNGKFPWRLGLTKCDADFAGANERNWTVDALKIVREVAPELTKCDDMVLNINRGLLFNDKASPQTFISSILESGKSGKVPCAPETLEGDCLDQNIEPFEIQFKQPGFQQPFEERISKEGDQLLEPLTIENPNDVQSTWASLIQHSKAQVKQIKTFASNVRTASNELREEQKLGVQKISAPIDTLCCTGQVRLIECFLAAEEAMLRSYEGKQLQNFKVVETSIEELANQGWILHDHIESLRHKWTRVHDALDAIAKDQGWKDWKDQLHSSSAGRSAGEFLASTVKQLSTSFVPFVVSSVLLGSAEAVGVASYIGGFEVLFGSTALGSAAFVTPSLLLLLGVILASRRLASAACEAEQVYASNRVGNELAGALEDALDAIRDSIESAADHKRALDKLRGYISQNKQ